jgi:hypothetical protein
VGNHGDNARAALDRTQRLAVREYEQQGNHHTTVPTERCARAKEPCRTANLITDAATLKRDC